MTHAERVATAKADGEKLIEYRRWRFYDDPRNARATFSDKESQLIRLCLKLIGRMQTALDDAGIAIPNDEA